jgi:hypothetical protein
MKITLASPLISGNEEFGAQYSGEEESRDPSGTQLPFCDQHPPRQRRASSSASGDMAQGRRRVSDATMISGNQSTSLILLSGNGTQQFGSEEDNRAQCPNTEETQLSGEENLDFRQNPFKWETGNYISASCQVINTFMVCLTLGIGCVGGLVSIIVPRWKKFFFLDYRET